MRSLVAAVVLSWIPAVHAQETDAEPVRVSIAHLFDSEDGPLAPPFWPSQDAPGLHALGPIRTPRFDVRLLDLVSYQGKRHFGLDRGPQVARDGTDLVVQTAGASADDLRKFVLDALDAYAPAVVLDVGVWRAGPGPVPVALSDGDLDRELARDALYSRRVARAGGHTVSVDLRGADGERAVVRVEPHLLAASSSIALLCEFAIDRRARDGSRLWTAGAASGVVTTGGALAISLPDRVLVVRASHEARAPKGLAGVPWSLLTTTGLRREPELGERPDLLRLEPVRAHWAMSEDVLIQRVRDRACPELWDTRITGDQVPQCLLVCGPEEDLQKALPLVRAVLGTLEGPLSTNAQADCLLTVEPEPAVPGVVRLPVLPERVACVLHAAWPAGSGEPRGGLVALTWTADREGRPPAASGFAAQLRGAALDQLEGEPHRFRGFELGRNGHADLVRTPGLTVEIASPR